MIKATVMNPSSDHILRVVLCLLLILVGTGTAAAEEVHLDIPRHNTKEYNFIFEYCVLLGDEIALEVYDFKTGNNTTKIKNSIMSVLERSKAPDIVLDYYYNAVHLIFDKGFTVQQTTDTMFNTCMGKVGAESLVSK